MINGSASSPFPKASANGALLVTPDSTRNLLIVLDGADDASLSNLSMNGGDTDVGGENPLDFTRELVTPPKLIHQSTDCSTGDEEMDGDITASCVVNKDGLVQVPKSIPDSKSTDDDLARINTDIGDAQHLIEISTIVALEIAKEDLL